MPWRIALFLATSFRLEHYLEGRASVYGYLKDLTKLTITDTLYPFTNEAADTVEVNEQTKPYWDTSREVGWHREQSMIVIAPTNVLFTNIFVGAIFVPAEKTNYGTNTYKRFERARW